MKRHWLQWLVSAGCITLGGMALLQAQRGLPREAAAHSPAWKGSTGEADLKGRGAPASEPASGAGSDPISAATIKITGLGSAAPGSGGPSAPREAQAAAERAVDTGAAFAFRFEDQNQGPNPIAPAGGNASPTAASGYAAAPSTGSAASAPVNAWPPAGPTAAAGGATPASYGAAANTAAHPSTPAGDASPSGVPGVSGVPGIPSLGEAPPLSPRTAAAAPALPAASMPASAVPATESALPAAGYPTTGSVPRTAGPADAAGLLAQAPGLNGPSNRAAGGESPEIIWGEPTPAPRGPAPSARSTREPTLAPVGVTTTNEPRTARNPGEPSPRTLEADPFAQPASPGSGRGSAFGSGNDRSGDRAGTAAPSESSGSPGEKKLEGRQAPRLTIEKRAPTELQVGQPAIIELVIRNEGDLPALRVEVRDEVPRGTQLNATNPQAVAEPRGQLVWKIGSIAPQAEAVVRMQVTPVAEGEIGSVATVTFQVQASGRSLVTRPRLVVTTIAPATAMIDEEISLKVKVANQGTGVAKGVVVRDLIPSGLRHSAGDELENELGDLAPGESRELDLAVRAVQPGKAVNQATAFGDGDLRSEVAKFEIEVIAPVIAMSVEGPKKRYLERPATYTVAVNNHGTAAARQLALALNLPAGMEFVKSDPPGRHDAQANSVHWLMEELPAQRNGSVSVTVLPKSAGSHNLVFEATAERTKAVRFEQTTLVEGVAAVLFQLGDVEDPIEVGGEAVYNIKVVNQGSKPASNVRLMAEVPSTMKFLAAESDARHTVQGNRVVFEPISSLAPKAEANIRIRVRCLSAGDLRFRCQLVTDDMEAPVSKEESTRVYADE